MNEAEMITVEVAHATSTKQVVIEVSLSRRATLAQAILASGILDSFPEIDLETASVGIFSKPADLSTQLADRDRIEIYRPLQVDPKEARRKRARKGVRT